MDSSLTVTIRVCVCFQGKAICCHMTCLVSGYLDGSTKCFDSTVWVSHDSFLRSLGTYLTSMHIAMWAQMKTEALTGNVVDTKRHVWNLADAICGELFSVCYRWTNANTQADNSMLRLKVIAGGIPYCEERGMNHCHRELWMEQAHRALQIIDWIVQIAEMTCMKRNYCALVHSALLTWSAFVCLH